MDFDLGGLMDVGYKKSGYRKDGWDGGCMEGGSGE